MSGIRRLLTCAVVAATLVIPSLASASSSARPHWTSPALSSGPRYEHFMAWVSGSQTTTWKQPTRSQGDCSYHSVTTPKGDEVVRFHSNKIKLLAIDYGLMVMFEPGTWSPSDFSTHLWHASGSTRRQDLTTYVWTPGPCDPIAKASPPPANDCNPTRVRHWDLRLDYFASDETVGLEFLPVNLSWLGRKGTPFRNCTIETTGQAVADTISDARASFPAKDLFAGHGKQIAIVHKTWSFNTPGSRISTTVQWTLTLVKYP